MPDAATGSSTATSLRNKLHHAKTWLLLKTSLGLFERDRTVSIEARRHLTAPLPPAWPRKPYPGCRQTPPGVAPPGAQQPRYPPGLGPRCPRARAQAGVPGARASRGAERRAESRQGGAARLGFATAGCRATPAPAGPGSEPPPRPPPSRPAHGGRAAADSRPPLDSRAHPERTRSHEPPAPEGGGAAARAARGGRGRGRAALTRAPLRRASGARTMQGAERGAVPGRPRKTIRENPRGRAAQSHRLADLHKSGC